VTGWGEWSETYTTLEEHLLEGRTSEEIERRWNSFEIEMQQIKKLAEEAGARTGIVVLPSRQQVSGEFPNAQIQPKVRDIADRLEMFIIDPLPYLRAKRDEVESLFIPYDRHHPSAAGHRLIADAIVDELNSYEPLRSAK
jgi:hypothetical protein